MVYEGEKQTLKFRPDGAAFVLFVDGHISLVNAKEANELIWVP
jgi:prepilin-type processing-associated H-X9-DG protein